MTIVIKRDRWGISHAETSDRLAAFEAQGWVAANDRIWQMDADRIKAQGRWAEIVGVKGAKEDAFFRRLGLSEKCRSDWSFLADETKAMTEAYADGVNRWLEANKGDLPQEYDYHDLHPALWEPWHCLAVYKIRHVFMGTLHRKLWRGYLLATCGPEVLAAMQGDINQDSVIASFDKPTLDLLSGLPEILDFNSELLEALADIDGGSNSWAIHGSRTASGMPLLAGDPHRGIEFPNAYHQFHMKCPEFNAIGLAFPGVPGFPHFGHNDETAWCITHGMADDTDLFIEGADLDRVEWEVETLKIRGEGEFEVFCGATDRGPVVIGDPADNIALSLAWTGISGNDLTFDCLLPMLNASSCSELEEAVEPWVIPVNNMLSADTQGHISFKIRGRVVERPIANRWVPVPGESTASWAQLEPVAFAELPGVTDPPEGYLVTANNRTSNSGPYISLDFAGPARYERISGILEKLTSADMSDMERIHGDVVSLRAPHIIAYIVNHASNFTHPWGDWLIKSLANWNHELSETSVEASMYAVIRRRWCESVGERLGVSAPNFGAPGWPSPEAASRMLADAAVVLLVDGKHTLIPGLETEEDLDQALSACIDEALTELELRFGNDRDSWTWGRLHRMISPHLMASAIQEAQHLHPPVDPCPGDSDTVRCGSVNPELGERAHTASVARYAFDLNDWDKSGWVVPHGVSGVRGSGHDLDQRRAWLACELLPMAFSEELVREAAVEYFEL